MTVVYSGGFYPWQNPDRFLQTAAKILDKIPRASLHVFGAPHIGLPNEAAVNAMLQRLQGHRCVRYYGYRPIEELMDTFATAWCALDLMERNIERELSISGRTLTFLASGTPVIHNNYSTLTSLIECYEAGWTVSPDDPAGLADVFHSLA